MRIDSSDIAAMDSRPRAALVNSLSGFKSANLVGTADADGASNLAVMSSCVHLGSHPPLLALIIRPGQEERHTLANILARGCFTLNHVNSLIVEQAHQTAARYPAQVSEFDATGLDEHWEPGFDAPFVAQAHVRIGLTLREHQTLAVNDTHLVIGQVALVFLPDNSLRSDGSLDLGSADTVALSGLDSYYLTALHRRMAYAKPDLPPRAIHPDNGELL